MNGLLLQLAAKRFTDVGIGLFATPVVGFLYLVLKIEYRFLAPANDRGTVLFKQERVQLARLRSGQLKYHSFVVLKFRSMRSNAGILSEQQGSPMFKFESSGTKDPHTTRIGHFLRVTKLDELPQLINVLKGDMSLVGFRPPLLEEVQCYDAEQVLRRFGVSGLFKPGLTGLYQVSSRADSACIQAASRYDATYRKLFRRYGVIIDVIVILRTIKLLAVRMWQQFQKAFSNNLRLQLPLSHRR